MPPKQADQILECDFPARISNRLNEYNERNEVNLYKYNNPLIKLASYK